MNPSDILTIKGDKISPHQAKKYAKECADILKEWPSLATWAYCSLNSIEPRCCKVCGKRLEVKSLPVGYVKETCSSDCRSKIVADSIRRTMLEKYGVDNASKIPSVREKARQTCIERYGHEMNLGCPEFAERARKSNVERYGTESPMKNEEVRARATKTNLERYGVPVPSMNEGVRERLKDSINTAYAERGVDIVSKRRSTNISKYGHAAAACAECVKEKTKSTNLQRYGDEFFTRSERYKNLLPSERRGEIKGLSERTSRILRSKELLEEELANCNMSAILFSEKHGISSSTAYRWIHFHDIRGVISRSAQEMKVENLLSDHGFVFESNNRVSLGNGSEIDVFVPSLSFGVECHGNLWHSYNPDSKYFKGRSDKNYHRKKLEAAEAAGIRLMQFFEDEINDKFDIVSSMIMNAVGKSERIHARKTEVKIIDSKVARAFCEANHINGYAQSKLQVGLFLGGSLVSVMTFSPSRYEKLQGAWEIVRFCSILNHTVVGGASKLIAAARKLVGQEMTCLLTYADLMHGTGNGYKACGFKEIGRTEVGYFWYSDNGGRESRQKYQRHKLEKVFNETFPNEMTENDIMFLKGYRKLYNAGNAKFLLEF